MDSQDYLEINIIVASEEASEIIEAELMDLGFDSFMYKEPELKCYIQSDLFDETAFNSALESLSEMVPSGIVDFSSSSLPDSKSRLTATVVRMPHVNWNAKWEQTGFTPIRVGNATVLPLGSNSETEISIYLDPQMAFGTGHHDTTRMMMETIQDNADVINGASVMDLGCGTAVLAILSAKLGAREVTGIDIDAVAARSAQENVRLNGESFPIICGDASSLETDSYDFILANIHRNIIISDMSLYEKALHDGGSLFLSGFYDSDAEDIVKAGEKCGLVYLSEKKNSSEWACIQLHKPIKQIVNQDIILCQQ